MDNDVSVPFYKRLYDNYDYGINWHSIVRNGEHLPHDTQERLIGVVDDLPHGSGIDSDWRFYETRSYYCLTNSYHAMDDNGMYDGWMDFTVKIRKDILNDADKLSADFVLQFNGLSSYHRRKYEWSVRDYLEQTIQYSLWLVDHEGE
jgi:hypothetical protein